MSEGQDVRGPPAAVTHHHRDGWRVPEVLQHDRDDIRPPLHDERHHRDTLADTCRSVEEEQEAGGGGVEVDGEWLQSGKNKNQDHREGR